MMLTSRWFLAGGARATVECRVTRPVRLASREYLSGRRLHPSYESPTIRSTRRNIDLYPSRRWWDRALTGKSLSFGLPECLWDVLVQASRIIAVAVALVGLCLAQQEPATPSFHAQTDLVTVPFQVRRGSRSVSDLKPSDVVLLEDGVPRGFTIFEAPPIHLTLDLVVMFDVTKKKERFGFWSAKTLQDLTRYWSEAISRRLLDGHGVRIRFSIYRFDQSALQRLCQSTSDPSVLLDALRRLAGPSAGQGPGLDVDIPLPAGLAIRDRERQAQAHGAPPAPWSLTGALSALRDSAFAAVLDKDEAGADRAAAGRALIIFSTGAEGTALTPEDLAGEAVAAGVPVYPVALISFPGLLPYDGYGYDGQEYYGIPFEGPRGSMFGPAGIHYCHPITPDCPGSSALYINYPFELLGDLTGGLSFEAVYHPQTVRPGQEIPGFRLSEANTAFSMTGGEADDILERVKRHALARFSSSYSVGFVPSPSASRREHKLEVKLASKSGGKVTEGKRTAVY